MTVINYYKALGVARDASNQDIKRAFRQAALRSHPDKNPGDWEAERRFKEVTAAYEVLGDARRRAEYDLQGVGTPPREEWGDDGAAEEIFESFFGVFPETCAATAAAEALLGQMGSFNFAEAMIKFCQQKQAACTPQKRGEPRDEGAPADWDERRREARPEEREERGGPDAHRGAGRSAPLRRQRWCDMEDGDEDSWWASPAAEAAPADADTLRGQLQQLQAEDQRCVLLVRGVNRLGFESREALEEFFGRSGELRRVLVTHARVKASGRRRERIRPAAIGFVVMLSREAAERQLAVGEHREIAGVAVKIQRFQHGGAEQSRVD